MCGTSGRIRGALFCALAGASCGATVVDTLRTREIEAAPSATSDAVLYYDFAADGSGVVQDASGHGHDGIAGGCAWQAAGRFAGGSMGFGGNGSGVAVLRAPDFPSWEAYSASVWFLHDGQGDLGPQYGHKILDKTSLGHDWHLSLRPEGHAGDDGAVGLFLYEDGRAVRLEDATRNWADGAWHHAVVIREGDHGELWIDGVRRAAGDEMFAVRGGAPLCIGNSRSADRHQRTGWSGRLDEVRIFDRALTRDEIACLYAEGGTGAGSSRVTFTAPVEVAGDLVVSGPAVFAGGIRLQRARGDLVREAAGGEAVPDAK